MKSEKEKTGRRYYILMGDEDDLVSASEREKLSTAELHDSTISTLDAFAKERTEALAEKLSFMKGRFLAMMEGNHHWLFTTGPLRGKTSTEYLATLLEAPWLGFLCYLRVSFRFENRGTARTKLDLVLCHGKSGFGKLMGNSINGVAELKELFPTGDVFIMGHDHGLCASPDTYFDVAPSHHNPGTLVVRPKRRLFCRSGGFLKAYEPGHSGYLVRRLARPSTLGSPELVVSFQRKTQEECTSDTSGIKHRSCIYDGITPSVKITL